MGRAGESTEEGQRGGDIQGVGGGCLMEECMARIEGHEEDDGLAGSRSRSLDIV